MRDVLAPRPAARALRAALAKQPQRTQIVHYGRVDSSAAADR